MTTPRWVKRDSRRWDLEGTEWSVRKMNIEAWGSFGAIKGWAVFRGELRWEVSPERLAAAAKTKATMLYGATRGREVAP